MSEANFILRQMQPSDHAMVFNSWLKSYRDAPTVKGIPNTAYYTAHHAIITRILNLYGIKAFVACDPKDPDAIFGYLVGETVAQLHPILHWVYVKHAFRGWKIASALYGAFNPSSAPFIYSHRTKTSDKYLGDRQANYNPYVLTSYP